MQNKYIKSLRLRAIQLDRSLFFEDNYFSSLVDYLIKENNPKVINRICKSLLEAIRINDTRVHKATKAFRESLIRYLGYRYIYESCREKSVIEEMDVDQLYGELNHPIYIQMLYL